MKIIKLIILLSISNIGFCVDGDGSGEPKSNSVYNNDLEQFILVDGDGSGITNNEIICRRIIVDGDGSGEPKSTNYYNICTLKANL